MNEKQLEKHTNSFWPFVVSIFEGSALELFDFLQCFDGQRGHLLVFS